MLHLAHWAQVTALWAWAWQPAWLSRSGNVASTTAYSLHKIYPCREHTHNTLSTRKYWLGKLLVSECHCQYSGISKTALLQPSYNSMLLVPPFFSLTKRKKNQWHLGFYYCQGDWKSLFGTDGLISEAVPLPICLKCCVPSLHASNEAKTGALSVFFFFFFYKCGFAITIYCWLQRNLAQFF